MRQWKHSIDFVASWEKKLQNEEITLSEMCTGILKSFYTWKWISAKPESNTEFQAVHKAAIPAYALEELEELVYGTLHSIAYASEIYEEGEDLPDLEDYDGWKEDLYNWCDEYSVWLAPTGL